MLELQQLCDPTNRCTDIAVRLVVYSIDSGTLAPTGQRSRVYGGVWDSWAQAYVADAKPSHVEELPCSKNQFDLVQYLVGDDAADIARIKALLYAGRGGGKSHGFALAANVLALVIPHGQGQIVAPTYAIGEILRDRLLQDLPTYEWLLPGADGIKVAARKLVYKTGFTWTFTSADRPQSLRAGDADVVLVEERQDIPQKAVDIVTFQMRKRGGYRMAQIGTPEAGSDFHEEYERYTAAKQWTRHFSSYDNPFIPHDVFHAAKQSMDPKMYQQEVEGLWVTLGDRVYEHFEWSVHARPYKQAKAILRKAFSTVMREVGDDITKKVLFQHFRVSADNLIGLDWGTLPFVCNSWKVLRTPDGVPSCLWGVDETVLEGSSNPHRMAAELKRKGYVPARTVIVADGSDSRASSFFKVMRGHGFIIVTPQKESRRNPGVRNRINATNAKMWNANSDITWYIDPKKAPLTARAYQRHQWGDRDKPLHDDNSHYTCAGDYALVRLFPAGTGSIKALYAPGGRRAATL